MSGKNYNLVVVLGRYQGQQYPLEPEREIVIGRTLGADIVFEDSMVSRRHAQLAMQGDDIILQDLGSTNGTFVDGIRITRTKVKAGDLILIGSNMINVQLVGLGKNGSNGAEPVTSDPPAKKVNGSASMSGLLDQIPLPDLIQLLSTSRKSGVLKVKCEKEAGRFFIKDGDIEYASIDNCSKMDPKKAVCQMMLWERGTFELHPPSQESFEIKITEPTDFLLLEAMRYHDEFDRLPPEKPDFNTVLSVVEGPSAKPVDGLPADQLAVIELVKSHGKVREVLSRSTMSDFETLRILTGLMKQGYLAKSTLGITQ